MASIQMTESTYALMMHMSTAMGVNCTYCHNSRSFGAWNESSPQRTTAWHGIRMAQQLNQEYVVPLSAVLPDYRKGPTGQGKKINCETCHQGVNKPLYGTPMAQDYPSLTPRSASAAVDQREDGFEEAVDSVVQSTTPEDGGEAIAAGGPASL